MRSQSKDESGETKTVGQTENKSSIDDKTADAKSAVNTVVQ